MKYKLQLIRVDNNKLVKEWAIPKIEQKENNIKVKFLPSRSEIKNSIRKDIKSS